MNTTTIIIVIGALIVIILAAVLLICGITLLTRALEEIKKEDEWNKNEAQGPTEI